MRRRVVSTKPEALRGVLGRKTVLHDDIQLIDERKKFTMDNLPEDGQLVNFHFD